ncbi:MAG: Hsp20/alpha crystallin family protein [Chloroflexi bacterium]|nr:Hsp20/alpha crystallin family protein [Chloroflexota bacterium]
MAIMQPFSGTWSVWRDMERLRREMDRLMASVPAPYSGAGSPTFPAMNVWTKEDGALVTAELPGVAIDDIEIAVEGDTLTLSGSRAAEELPEGARLHRRERGTGNFSRVFRLPFPIDSEKVEAILEDGVLTIALPRPESDMPRRISVKAA